MVDSNSQRSEVVVSLEADHMDQKSEVSMTSTADRTGQRLTAEVDHK